MTRTVDDVLRIMRLAISRRNTNDPDADDTTLLSYLNDFVTITMGADVRLFDQYGTLNFTIDNLVSDGVYTFNDVGADQDFESITGQGFISLANPPNGSISWIPLNIWFNPYDFYEYWGIDNEDLLNTGMPTEMLYYDNKFVFRTIPDQSYNVTLYGYKKASDFSTVGSPALDFDNRLRFYAYGAALNYAMDYRYSPDKVEMLKRDYNREKRLMLTRTHNQIKRTNGVPSF